MDVLGWVGAVAGGVGAATGVAAVVVSVIYNRRLAIAAEVSADSSRQSAIAAQRSADVAERDEQQRIQDRHEAEGPQFEQDGKSTWGETTDVKLRVRGGPGPMRLRVHCQGVPWVRGVSNAGGLMGTALELVGIRPDELVMFTVHLSVEPWEEHSEITLPATIEAQSSEEPPRAWTREVSVRLVPPPWMSVH